MQDLTPVFFYEINYKKVVNDDRLLPITRALALDIQTNPYFTIERFLKKISDDDLIFLLELADDPEAEHFPELIVITEMLANAEGLMDEWHDPEEMIAIATKRANALVGFLAIERLARSGIVKAFRENMSLGEEFNDKVIVEKL